MLLLANSAMAQSLPRQIDSIIGDSLRAAIWKIPEDNRVELLKYVGEKTREMERRISLERMDEFFSLTPHEEMLKLTPEQVAIIGFIENCCAVEFVNYEYECNYVLHKKAEDMPYAGFEAYKFWYLNHRKYISPLLIKYYCLVKALNYGDYIVVKNNMISNEFIGSIMMQMRSLPYMYLWYEQGGDINKLPPQGIINAGFFIC